MRCKPLLPRDATLTREALTALSAPASPRSDEEKPADLTSPHLTTSSQSLLNPSTRTSTPKIPALQNSMHQTAESDAHTMAQSGSPWWKLPPEIRNAILALAYAPEFDFKLLTRPQFEVKSRNDRKDLSKGQQVPYVSLRSVN